MYHAVITSSSGGAKNAPRGHLGINTSGLVLHTTGNEDPGTVQKHRWRHLCLSPCLKCRINMINGLSSETQSPNRFFNITHLVCLTMYGSHDGSFKLLFQINMEAVTSTDYNSENLSRNFNQVGFNTYNYSQFEEKYKPRRNIKTEEYPRNVSVRNPSNSRNSSRHSHEPGPGDKTPRSHSQPERQHHSSHEMRSKSQDSRELTFYQIDPPLKHENRHSKCHRSSFDKVFGKSKELTFYEIDGPPHNSTDKIKDRDKDKSGALIHPKHNHGKQINVEQKGGNNYNRSESDGTENFHRPPSKPYVEPPKYRQFDRPPRYQEDPPRPEPPPKYHQDPPKYSEVSDRRQDDLKRPQVGERTYTIYLFLSICYGTLLFSHFLKL